IDIVVGIAASGRTPYVKGGLKYANYVGAETVAVSNNVSSAIGKIARTQIEVDCGPEVLSGSTRLKAGTAQKMILNMLSTASMDIVVGIAASGRTPYVKGGLKYANYVGAETVAVSNNVSSAIGKIARTQIEVDCGPEVLSGSTRLKAGTAQKMILNMLSTASMVGIGKTYQNLLVDLQPTNKKLVER